jgi:hypothetical protein
LDKANNKRARVAVLGTLAEFHREPIPYDMSVLLELVAEINPDLLCLDMTPEQWHESDFEGLPPEYQEAGSPDGHCRRTNRRRETFGNGRSSWLAWQCY